MVLPGDILAASAEHKENEGMEQETASIDHKDMLNSDVSQLRINSDEKGKPTETSDETGGDGSDCESEDGVDKYRINAKSDVIREISAVRRREDAAFKSWVEKRSRRDSATTGDKDAKALCLDRQSTASLIQSNEATAIIKSPREYQMDLYHRAKERNSIIVLDTGSGKTLIAALLLRHTLDNELERRARGLTAKVAFFLVDKVALCFQQYSVLRANLEHSVAKFHGEVASVMRSKSFWDKQINETMVFVCTAQVVLDCLNSGFIQMKQINLLIFDEAHHTKKNHPYARIIKDHYLRETGTRPRILGMTASPVDAQTRDLRAAASELESILCSEIATISDESLMRSQAQRQQVLVTEMYDKLLSPEDSRTPLWKEIHSLLAEEYEFRDHFQFSQDAASTLGSWCSDRYWQLLMTDMHISKRVSKAQTRTLGSISSDGLTDSDRVSALLNKVQLLTRSSAASKSPEVDTSKRDLSSKVITLWHILDEAFRRRQTKRCIVFVQKRYTALLLSEAFEHLANKIFGLSTSFLVGSSADSWSISSMSFREQILTLQRFRRGEVNCIFATQVAEEGIDIPECDLIIRFDLCDSAIQYIQSKGRARQAQSTYINMAEQGNNQHVRKLMQAARDAYALRQFCSAMPADRKVQDSVDMLAVAEHERTAQKVFEIPETGARLTFQSSQEVLAKFVSCLSDSNTSYTPEYIVTPMPRSKKFVATIILPDASPYKSFPGNPQRNKQLARCSAAFEACVCLYKSGWINSNLQPTMRKRLPAMRNARLALSSNKRSEYPMRIKAELWSHLGMPSELYGAILVLDTPESFGRPLKSLALLTRQPLPAMEPAMLFFDQGQTSIVRLRPMASSVSVTTADVETLSKFTLTIFTDVFSKDYDAEPEGMPYFWAPMVKNEIDWRLLRQIVQAEPPTWQGQPDEFFHDKLAMDPWDGSRKFIIHGVNKDMKPSDPEPQSAPIPQSRSYKLVDHSIKEYSNSLTIKARRRIQWREDQPVVNAELLSLRRNFLDEYSSGEMQDMRCWLILEPLRISTLPTDVAAASLLYPVMMYRLDSLLIALEACNTFDLEIQPRLALEALTKDSSNTEEHGSEQIDFQVGMGNNYERLEFLGDAFLKMATTISLFTLMPRTNEFEYHVERMLLVCNQNLFNHAVDSKMQQYVRSKSFDRRTWYPQLSLKRGKAPKNEIQHSLSDKSIADVCEAMIGAAYMTGKAEGSMDAAVKAVSRMVKSKNHKMTKYADYYEAYKMPEWQVAVSSAAQRAAVDRIHESTKYRFRYPNLLRSVFKHPSYPHEMIPNYQRLEFLGDALLDLVIVDYLFERFPKTDPQWLTEHKMAMVSNHFFGSLCVQLGLQKHLLMTTSSLIGQISEYAIEMEQAREAAKLEANGAQQDFWLTTSQPPKVLSDMLEALVGAMFVDSGYDFQVVRRFFGRFIEPFFEDMTLYDTYASRHPVTALSQLLQVDMGCQRWRLYVTAVPAVGAEGVAVLTEDEVVCALMVHEKAVEHATGKTVREAKLVVARKALQQFDAMSPDEFRASTKCDCRCRDEATMTCED
ncbi:hypothetical protein CDD81_7186 [Ophiocordyceps australis]|uniref:Dicer-like protein 1 n=1 Tax=Ophiocordyceps australis TaxID=1399860 RepID=A0A2C5Y4N5_9HYPO|nr:hypothetical protein CDD81_7186 [Ophiocordyceps australis]